MNNSERHHWTILLFILFLSGGMSENLYGQADGEESVQFRKQMIASESFESAGVFDVNSDGNLDIVSGWFWYEGPDFWERYYIGEITYYEYEYWDDFSTIPMDINGDGHTDFVTGSFFSRDIRWRENPGDDSEWAEHIIDETGPVETTRSWDVDGDGYLEIVPNNPGRSLKFYKLERDNHGNPKGSFSKIVVSDDQGHGLGFGDINGDGRGDFVLSTGWLEAPADPVNGTWKLHEEFDLGTASVPILVVDVNENGKKDLIVGQGHDYGLDWYEQTTDATGNREWIKHPIDPDNSQFHTMEWIDLDGDGRGELITGKRYRAHSGNDSGTDDPIGLYYYKWNGQSFNKHTIAYGLLGVGKGTGIYFSIADLRGSGHKDIVVAGKDGLYVFFNEGLQ